MEQRHLRHLITSLVAIVALQVQARAQQQLPRLVVCISVDELRTDYLQELSGLMGEDGFKRILHQGKVYPSVHYPHIGLNRASSTATLFTGTLPREHGIEGVRVYDAKANRYQDIFLDPSVIGLYTRDQYSPKALGVNTLGDRLKEASAGSALVYGVAPYAEEAISSSGILADGAFWIDNKIGSWATSSYYGSSMPPYIDRYNRSEQSPNKRLIQGDFRWKPLRSYATPRVMYNSWGQDFSYRYQGTDVLGFKQSALVNEEVTNLALRLIEGAGYETRTTPGLLSISLNAGVSTPSGQGELNAEEVDNYVRLDGQIARLLKALQERIGLNNCLITLSGTGYSRYRKPRFKRGDLVYKEFSLQRSQALLGMYLTALYGQGTWIDALRDGRVYLNQKLIERTKLSLSEVRKRVANFLAEMEGVDYAYTLEELVSGGDSSRSFNELRGSVSLRHPADIYFGLTPGWSIDTSSPDQNTTHLYTTAIPSPFIIMGAGIDPKTFEYPVVEVTDIVRVIAHVLRIRPPNASR